MAGIRVGLDLGGTKLLCVALDVDSSAIVGTKRLSTPIGNAAIIDAMAGLVADVERDVGVAAISVGIGAAGLVDPAGVLRFGPNLPGVVDLDIPGSLSPILGRPVAVDNDATCATVAEHRVGAARGASDAIVVSLGTGIGGGVVMGGRVQRGAHHLAGEIGHILVDPSGPLCGCGQRGCWEQFASGSALGRLGREAAVDGRAPAVLAKAGGDASQVGGSHVVAAAADGAPDALQVIDTHVRWIAVGLAALVNIIDPALVVIGGGLVENGDLHLDPVRRHLELLVVGGGRRPSVPVLAAETGELAAAIGAALLGAGY